MICKNLAYWVFTSGEEGVHGLDWGIKHASKSFADRYKLDSRYRSLLEDFSLSPSLEQERAGAGAGAGAAQEGGADPPALARRGKGSGRGNVDGLHLPRQRP